MTSTRIPVRSSIAATTASRFPAIRKAAVPTAAMANAPSARASAAMTAIASAVLAAAAGEISPRSCEALAEARHVGTVADRESSDRR